MRPPLPALEPETEAFWRACRAGRLEIARCRACGWYVHPPRPICPRCHATDVRPQAVSGRATVASYTVNHKAWMPGMDVPYVIALVELVEQADLRLTTNLVGCQADGVAIGMPVKVTFEVMNDDVALPLFEPDDDRPPPEPAPRMPQPVTPAIRPSAQQHLERRAILSGVGQSQIGRRLYRTGLDLTCEAALAAIADAGLEPADIAPKGISHCEKPEIARAPAPIPSRPAPAAALASVTVRYTSACRQRPAATASAACMTGAICAGPSSPEACHPSWRPRASWTSGVPGPAKPTSPVTGPG